MCNCRGLIPPNAFRCVASGCCPAIGLACTFTMDRLSAASSRDPSSTRVEGEPQSVLHPGDVFYEPEGARIARFDAGADGASFSPTSRYGPTKSQRSSSQPATESTTLALQICCLRSLARSGLSNRLGASSEFARPVR